MNPAWNRDELIVALDAYVRWDGNPPAKSSDAIDGLSALLNDLHRALGTKGDDNPYGNTEAVEGRVVTVLHQKRERSRSLVEKRKKAALAAGGRLSCEACKFHFGDRYGERGGGFIECHHTRPVETLGDGTPTNTNRRFS